MNRSSNDLMSLLNKPMSASLGMIVETADSNERDARGFRRRPAEPHRALRRCRAGDNATTRKAMAVNKPIGDDARKGAVRKRSQLKTKMEGAGELDQAQPRERPVHGRE